MYILYTFTPLVNRCTSSSVWHRARWIAFSCEALAVRILVATAEQLFFSFSHCFFFFCQETIYRMVAFCLSVSCVKKESYGAFNHSFISIAFAQYQVIMWRKNNQKSSKCRKLRAIVLSLNCRSCYCFKALGNCFCCLFYCIHVRPYETATWPTKQRRLFLESNRWGRTISIFLYTMKNIVIPSTASTSRK